MSSSLPLSGCWFEWGVAPHLEDSAPCQLSAPEGDYAEAHLETHGLESGVTYAWRLAAGNGAGPAHGSSSSFTTNGFPIESPEAATQQLVEKLPSRPSAPARPGIDDGLYVAHCPSEREVGADLAPRPRAAAAMANHTGWPPLQCLKMDKGTYGHTHVLVGLAEVHNYLLGGYGDDTIWGGDDGDVIWGDYQPSGQSTAEHDALHGGSGSDWIYSSHGENDIWTGAGDDHVALVYGYGTVHCNGPGHKTLVMRLLPRNRHWRLEGCHDVRIEPYRA